MGRKHKARHQQLLEDSEPFSGPKPNKGKGQNKNKKEKSFGSKKGKQGGQSGRRRRMGQEESRLVDENTPPDTLESRTLESLAKYIKDGKAKNIVVMVGAGISTSAGIPDFRSPDTGLYANLARLNLPFAEAVFDISYFRQKPEPFYALAQELYPGRYRPTITHSFLRLLRNKGLLLKLFTQNIDCLEREAGLEGDYIVEAHGSFASQSCIECHDAQPDSLMRAAIAEKSVPRCTTRPRCGGLVKPDIVFFGEQLPAEFFRNRTLPGAADLCIVMGTSLTVQPFASLPGFCSEGVPRLLINQEAVGSLGSRADDVLLLGDCDSGVRKLAAACGWLKELESLWAKTVAKDAASLGRPEKSAEEKQETVEDEVDKLAREVDETLKIAEDHQKRAWSGKGMAENRETEKGDAAKEETSRNDKEEKEDAAKRDETTKDEAEDTVESSTTAVSENSDSRETKEQRGDEGGLRHVFPHFDRKPAL